MHCTPALRKALQCLRRKGKPLTQLRFGFCDLPNPELDAFFYGFPMTIRHLILARKVVLLSSKIQRYNYGNKNITTFTL